jgi:hypothetical protein
MKRYTPTRYGSGMAEHDDGWYVLAADYDILATKNAQLLVIAKRYASECLNCGGHGFVYEGEAITGRGPDDVFPNQVACDECADIRALIGPLPELPEVAQL